MTRGTSVGLGALSLAVAAGVAGHAATHAGESFAPILRLLTVPALAALAVALVARRQRWRPAGVGATALVVGFGVFARGNLEPGAMVEAAAAI